MGRNSGAWQTQVPLDNKTEWRGFTAYTLAGDHSRAQLEPNEHRLCVPKTSDLLLSRLIWNREALD